MSEALTFFELADLLDRLISLQAPATEQVEEAVQLVNSEMLERYFFRHLAASENPAWFEPLRQRSFFDSPPELIEREGEVSYPGWSPLGYLVAVATKLPAAVVEVAGRIQTQNLFVYLELVRAAQRMPPMYAARMVPFILRWVDQGMRVEEDVFSLAVHLAQGDQWDAALALLRLILSPEQERVSNRAVAKAEKYYVQRFVEQDLAFFLDRRPSEILAIVQKNLEQALEIENSDADTDSSMGWRPAIEPHEQNWGGDDIKDLLVDAAIQALEYIVKNTPDQGKSVVETYLRHRFSIFRRLAIHSIRMNASLWPDLVEDLFVDKQYLDDKENYQIYHEYWMLMADSFDALPASIQHDFVERLLEKLPSEEMETDGSYHMQRYWVLRRMWAIRDSLHLDGHRKVLADLVSKYGEPDHPSFLSYSSVWVGSASPKTTKDLVNMSPEQILEELRKNLPFNGVGEPDQKGLAHALQAAIASAPQHLAPIAPKLFGTEIPPIFTYHAIRGFREAWKTSDFDWEPVLDLCNMVSSTGEPELDSSEPPDMRPGYWMTTYASARSAVADLLEAGVIRDDKSIPCELLPRVRDILLILTNDPNPSPEYEKKRFGSGVPHGVLTIALNVTRGKAVEALMQYALHVARISSQEPEQPTQARSRMEDKVKDRLLEKLDKHIDPSLAVHCLFGKYLPNLHYLDGEWLSSSLELIFPRQPEMSDYWEAAWDGYLFRSDFFGYLYEEMLRPYYRYALEQIALGECGRAGSDASRGRLAQHLAALYWRGIETLEDDDSLVILFFDSAPGEIRAQLIHDLGRALEDLKPSVDSEEWLRAKALWVARFRAVKEIAEREGSLTDYIAELSAFSQWVPFIPDDIKDFYLMIRFAALKSGERDVNRLMEFLASVAGDHAPFAVSLLEELLKQDHRGSWFLVTGQTAAHIRKILEIAMSFDDDQAKSDAVRVINLFGERGDERYRPLLKLR